MSVFPNTPTSLLTRIAAELSGEADEAAWTEFFELYEPAMRNYLTVHGMEDSEDIVQKVFAKLVPFLRAGRYDRSRGQFRAYLATLLYREMISSLRYESARGGGNGVSLDEADVVEANDPAMLVDVDWRLSLHKAIVRHIFEKTALSQQSKAVFEDLERTGDNCAEVAKRHGISSAAVRQISSRVSRMIAAMEKRFSGEL